MASITWKAAAGREEGGQGYRFGDLTRSLVRVATGQADQQGGLRSVAKLAMRSMLQVAKHEPDGGGSADIPPPRQLFESTEALLEAARANAGEGTDLPTSGPLGPDRSPLMAKFWLNFFNAVHNVGQQAVLIGLVDLDDIVCQEPELFLGLPGLAFFECVLRSVGQPGFVLSSGERVDAEAKHAASLDAEGQAILQAGEEIKALLDEHELSDEVLLALRNKIVRASGEAVVVPDPILDAHVNRIASKAIAAATTLSQLPFFRALFMLVFSTLAEDRPPTEPYVKAV